MPAPQDPQRPFERDAFFDDPGIVGARWWNRSFDVQMEATRRQAMKALGCFGVAIAGVAVLGIGGIAAAIAGAPDRALKKALDVQRQVGWSAGSFDEPLTWTGAPTQAADPGALARLASTLQPKRHAPFHVATQLEALGAVPTAKLAGSSYVVKDLRTELKSVRTPAMDANFASGKTLARIFAGRNLQTLVIVDAFGVNSAAFAAGAATTFEPVLVLDNWPHPAGVVPAHQTLGALAAYERELAAGIAARGPTPPPLFVLERERTDTLTDPEVYFDNRYFATLPSADTLKKWAFTRVLLIVQDEGSLPEAGDVGAMLAECAAAGMDVRCRSLSLFSWDGSYPGGDAGFFHHTPWAPASGAAPPPLPVALSTWRPGQTSTRITPKSPPAGFGQVYVYASGGGIVGIPAYGGTRARSSGGYGG